MGPRKRQPCLLGPDSVGHCFVLGLQVSQTQQARFLCHRVGGSPGALVRDFSGKAFLFTLKKDNVSEKLPDPL